MNDDNQWLFTSSDAHFYIKNLQCCSTPNRRDAKSKYQTLKNKKNTMLNLQLNLGYFYAYIHF
jgi:hypothetical protein